MLLCRTLIATVLLGLLAAPAVAETVLVLGSDSSTEVTDAADALVATGLFAAGDVTEQLGPAAPLLADLTAHDVVLVWGFAPLWDDADALGDVLADAVDAGVGVVVGSPLDPGLLPGGRWASAGYSPVAGSTGVTVAGDIDFADPSTDTAHPALAGLSAVVYLPATVTGLTLSATGTTFAVDTAGEIVGAQVCDRGSIVTTLFPSELEPGGSANDEARLWLAQMLLATVTEDPEADAGDDVSVAEGGSTTLDASDSDAGDFGPLTFAWDLDNDGTFDDATGDAPTFSAASLDGPDSVPVTLRVTDACGRIDTDSLTVTITNADPSITSATQDGPADEPGTVAFTAAASDPGGDSVTFSWDFDDGSPAGSGAAPSHTYDDSGTYTVTVTADDGEGGTDSTTVPVTINNLPPTGLSVSGDSSVVLGQSASLTGSATDPAGAADPLTYTWAWGDTTSDSGVDLTSVSHTYAEPGTFTVTVTVDDGDGGSTSDTAQIEVTNPGPSLTLASSPGTRDEAQSGSYSVTASDVLGDPVTVTWDWGDSSADDSGLDLVSASHAYADDGTFTTTITATDAYGGSASTDVDTVVANLDPSISSSPGTAAEEGTPYSASLAATDVPADQPDLVWIAQSAPASATFNPSTATFSWNPSLDEALGGAVTFGALVSDGDGGTDELSWVVTTAFEDDDNDGMADSWELDNGLDPTLDDSLGDPDADGVSNGDEWLEGTDPQVFGGPDAPAPTFPIDGESTDTAEPALTVANATDPDGDVLTYAFEVYADGALTVLVDSEDGIAEGASETAWTPTGTLAENTRYFWRARAADARVSGAWSIVSPFFVDEANDPPAVPTPLSPDASTVDTPLPGFVVAVGADPEGDSFVVEIELVDETESAFVPVVGDGFAEDGTWLATPGDPLAEDHEFSWRARSADVRGGASDWSDVALFEVDVSNTAPPVPTVVAPTDGSEVSTALPDLIVAVGEDVDGDPLTVVFSVDLDPAFASDSREDLGPVAVEAGEATAAVTEALPENATVTARARAEDDRGGASAWVVWSFVVDATDEAPSGPRILAPEDTATVDGSALEIRWAPADDPEGDALTYEISIASDPDGETFWSGAGLTIPDGDAEGATTVDVEVPAGAWTAAARATDATGQVGPWGPLSRFVVLPVEGTGADLEAGDGPYGCDCASSVAGGAGSGAVLALLVLPWAVRRRR